MLQTDRILQHLKEQGSITPLEAINLYGITRLSAVIYKLKHKGHDIHTVEEEDVNRYGEKTRYARYFYREGEK